LRISPNLPCLPALVPTEGGAGRLLQREEIMVSPFGKGGSRGFYGNAFDFFGFQIHFFKRLSRYKILRYRVEKGEDIEKSRYY
jgi:hypothetical protein